MHKRAVLCKWGQTQRKCRGKKEESKTKLHQQQINIQGAISKAFQGSIIALEGPFTFTNSLALLSSICFHPLQHCSSSAAHSHCSPYHSVHSVLHTVKAPSSILILSQPLFSKGNIYTFSIYLSITTYKSRLREQL